jgi:hypothetical protein
MVVSVKTVEVQSRKPCIPAIPLIISRNFFIIHFINSFTDENKIITLGRYLQFDASSPVVLMLSIKNAMSVAATDCENGDERGSAGGERRIFGSSF